MTNLAFDSWLGHLPPHWIRTRFGQDVVINEGQVDPTKEPWSSMVLVAPNHIESGTGRIISLETARDQGADSGKYRARSGQVLYSKIRPALNKVAIAPVDCLCSADMYPISGRHHAVDNRFLAYWMLARPFAAYATLMSDRVKMPKVNREEVTAAPWARPPLAEQWRIADFLDAETARIDRLTTVRRAQVDRLQELSDSRLAAAIDQLARTHGWISLRRVVTSVEQGWSPQCDDVIAEPDEWAVLKTSAVSSGEFAPLEHKRLPADIEPESRYRVVDGDILMTRGSGSPDHVGMAAEAKIAGRHLLLSDLLYRIRLGSGWLPEFVTLALHSKPVRGRMGLLFRGQSGQTIKLRAEDIRSIDIPSVPPALQAKIASELSAERAAIRNAGQSLESSLVLLAERRQALITAAVTGGITV